MYISWCILLEHGLHCNYRVTVGEAIFLSGVGQLFVDHNYILSQRYAGSQQVIKAERQVNDAFKQDGLNSTALKNKNIILYIKTSVMFRYSEELN